MERLRTQLLILLAALLAVTANAQDAMPPADGEGFVEIEDGARIFYQTWGEGQPMLLVHGYPLNGGLFRDNVAALSEQHRVVTVDLRGYGQSETPSERASIELYASDVLAGMDELDLQPTIIGGMSMGGPIVFEMYRQAPDRFAGMILIDTIAAPASPPEVGLWRGVADQGESMGPDSVIGFLMPDMLTGDTRMNRPEVVDHLASLMRAASLEAWLGGADALATRPDSTGTLAPSPRDAGRLHRRPTDVRVGTRICSGGRAIGPAHANGDVVLSEDARRLRRSLRANDRLVRILAAVRHRRQRQVPCLAAQLLAQPVPLPSERSTRGSDFVLYRLAASELH